MNSAETEVLRGDRIVRRLLPDLHRKTVARRREPVRVRGRFLNGGGWQLVGAFKEHESGKIDARPALARAIDQCHRTGARLVVAELASAQP